MKRFVGDEEVSGLMQEKARNRKREGQGLPNSENLRD